MSASQTHTAGSVLARSAIADKLRAMAVHFAVSALVGLLAAALVFAVWYPEPYGTASGAGGLFLLVVSVDAVLGPLLTFVVFDRRKARAELARDLGVIVALQMAGLAYGLYTMEQARPVAVALEGSRLRVVRSIDLLDADYGAAPAGLERRPWFGPALVATRTPRPDERLEVITRGLAGQDIGGRPEFWLPPSQTPTAWAAAARPLAELRQMHPKAGAIIDAAVASTGMPAGEVKFLPLLARRNDVSALIDGEGKVVGQVPLDGHR